LHSGTLLTCILIGLLLVAPLFADSSQAVNRLILRVCASAPSMIQSYDVKAVKGTSNNQHISKTAWTQKAACLAAGFKQNVASPR
jgi:hypothetical protein